MRSLNSRAPAFAEIDVLQQRVVEKLRRTWRIAICRHRIDGDLVVLFANRDKVHGGARTVLYRGDDPDAARRAADVQLGKGFTRGYRPSDGAAVEAFTWGLHHSDPGRERTSLYEVLRRPRTAA